MKVVRARVELVGDEGGYMLAAVFKNGDVVYLTADEAQRLLDALFSLAEVATRAGRFTGANDA